MLTLTFLIIIGFSAQIICQVLFSICQQTSGRVILWPKKLKLHLGHQWQQQQEEHSTGYVSGLGTKSRAGEEVSSYTLYSSGIAEPYFTLQWEENTCRYSTSVTVRGEISTTEEEEEMRHLRGWRSTILMIEYRMESFAMVSGQGLIKSRNTRSWLHLKQCHCKFSISLYVRSSLIMSLIGQHLSTSVASSPLLWETIQN